MIYIFCGLSGTGKSYLARLFAQATGYPLLQSDVIRKELAGMAPLEKSTPALQDKLYSEEFTRQTYEELLRRSMEYPHSILDATFTRQWQRNLVERSAAEYVYILCQAPENVIRQRILQRQQRDDDPSEAGLDIYYLQRERFEDFRPNEPVLLIDTYQQSPWEVVNQILQRTSPSPEDHQ